MTDDNLDSPQAVTLTADQMNHIAELAAEKALDKVYTQVGKGVLRKTAWVIGLGVISLLMYLGSKGIPLK